jgi:hypothetical protein
MVVMAFGFVLEKGLLNKRTRCSGVGICSVMVLDRRIRNNTKQRMDGWAAR